MDYSKKPKNWFYSNTLIEKCYSCQKKEEQICYSEYHKNVCDDINDYFLMLEMEYGDGDWY